MSDPLSRFYLTYFELGQEDLLCEFHCIAASENDALDLLAAKAPRARLVVCEAVPPLKRVPPNKYTSR